MPDFRKAEATAGGGLPRAGSHERVPTSVCMTAGLGVHGRSVVGRCGRLSDRQVVRGRLIPDQLVAGLGRAAGPVAVTCEAGRRCSLWVGLQRCGESSRGCPIEARTPPGIGSDRPETRSPVGRICCTPGRSGHPAPTVERKGTPGPGSGPEPGRPPA